jgi:hypothetical protein
MRLISALAVVALGAAAACAHVADRGGGKPLDTKCGQLRVIKVTVNAALKASTIDPDVQAACAGDFVLWQIENRLDEQVTVELKKFHEKGNPANGKTMKWEGGNKRIIPSKFTAAALAQIPGDIAARNKVLLIVKYTVGFTAKSGSHDIDPELQVDPPPDSMMGRLQGAPVLHVALLQR